MVCVITSNQYTDSFSIALENDDFEVGILPEASVIKVHKLFTIHQSMILKRFGSVTDDFFAKVEVMVNELIESESR